jgi:ribonucleoside-diphosphate reductase beta chain
MLQERKIFNELGDDSVESRSLTGGNTTGIANLNSVRYAWAPKLLKIMINNFWIPEKIPMVEDKVSMKTLDENEMRAFKATLSFLIALDSMQTANLPRLANYITAPEVSAIYTWQEGQELIHSLSYQYLLQELFSSNEREEIYNLWRDHPTLLKRNKAIADMYQQFIDNPTEETFKIALAADFALEGIYFYNGFNFFYQLAARQKAVQVAKMIKYIENDEVTHVSFMNYQIKEFFDLNNPADVELLRSVLMKAVQEEIEWGWENYGDNILGISMQSTEQYLKYLGNQRAKLIGLGVLYKGFNTNPYDYLNGTTRENFFETTVTEYSQSTAVEGWDTF